MRKTDLILLHAPSVYDFRDKPILHGPVSDVVPSTQIFEMYPLGFLTMLSYLQRHGHSVRIINVALKMLRSRRFNVDRLIRSLNPKAFGIDLHWMVHAQGSLELAAIVKKHHPDTPVIFGGLSASHYHEELIDYPQVDYVFKGDSVEEPLRMLMDVLGNDGDPGTVPNLTWKKNGQVHINDITHSPADMDTVSFDYMHIMRSCARHLDLVGHLPFKSWTRYPIVASLVCRGCNYNCPTCGGSANVYRANCGRSRTAFRSPELLAGDMGVISRHIKAPIMVLGDILQGGRDYADRVVEAIAQENIHNHIAFEFFVPPPRDFLEHMAQHLPNFNIQISPESHDEKVRRVFGRPYGNAKLEAMISDALELGCKRVDAFFMIGIPEQTVRSVGDTVEYCGELMERVAAQGHAGQFRPFISPLAPFLDPGSDAFMEPEKHGYRLFHRTLAEHRQALLAPSWKYTMNYESKWMTRNQLVDCTYDAALKLNGLKAAHGLLTEQAAKAIGERIRRERKLMAAIDNVVATEAEDSAEQLTELMTSFQATSHTTLCPKEEMHWPTALMLFNPLRIARSLLTPAPR